VTASNRRQDTHEHPWREIDLDVYERHMGDPGVGQLQRLHEITAEQLAAYPSRAIGVLGVAGGNGLDLIDPETTDAVYGYDINPDYLAACGTRYRDDFGDRLHLIEMRIDRSVRIERVDLLIANLIIEYVGIDEFVAFAAANARSIGVLSCVIQQNAAEGFVSSTDYTSLFDALASVSSDIDLEMLTSATSDGGYRPQCQSGVQMRSSVRSVRQDAGECAPCGHPDQQGSGDNRCGGRANRRPGHRCAILSSRA
jgi:hypothetical protein